MNFKNDSFLSEMILFILFSFCLCDIPSDFSIHSIYLQFIYCILLYIFYIPDDAYQMARLYLTYVKQYFVNISKDSDKF